MVKVKILNVLNGRIVPPPTMLIIKPKMIIMFWEM